MIDRTTDGQLPAAGTALRQAVQELVSEQALTGAAVATVQDDEVAVLRLGSADLAGRRPIGDGAIFPLSSVTKPIISALAARLVEDGVLSVDDPIGRWMPELASPNVLNSPAVGRPHEVVPAAGPVLVGHVLDSTCGWGFPGDLSQPGVAELLDAVGDPRRPHEFPEPDVWVAGLARVPLLRQPGERWLYETPHDLLGVLLARAAGRPLPALLTERLLDPLGMHRTGFAAAAEHRDDVVQAVRWEDGALREAQADDPAATPRFPSGAGGLVASLDDLVRFARVLLRGGELDGVRVLTPASVDAMTADRLTPAHRSEGGFFLDGQSWGQGGMVDIAPRKPWQAPGRYGWVGVSGASLHVRRDRGTAVICLTSRELWTADDTAVLERIWTAAAADLG